MSTIEVSVELRGQNWTCNSPTLRRLQAATRPRTLCTVCPLADWFDQDGLQCYCMQRHYFSYGNRAKIGAPVVACDAREVAITDEMSKASAG